MKRYPYSAGAVKRSFWFPEFKKTIVYLAEGMTEEEIKLKNKEENIFSASSEARGLEIFKTSMSRIKSVDSSFVTLFMSSSLSEQKLLCLIACMCQDTFFFDFVYEIIRDKYIIGLNNYDDSDIRKFIINKQQQREDITKFTDAGLKRLMSTYKLYLAEAGITDRAIGKRELYKPIISGEIKKWLIQNDLQPVLSALTGE